MATTGSSKRELEELIDDIAAKVQDMLDPALSREDLVGLVQELDIQLNGDDDEDEEGDEDEDEDED